ncbi:MAG: hypothetical protein AB1916_09005 [Thermodesulfobacteriota bacterium]
MNAPGPGRLLAVDLGLRMGLALLDGAGRPVWLRSKHLGALASLRRAAHSILRDLPELELLVLEGGGPAADIWAREAARREVRVRVVSAQDWRPDVLAPSQQRDARSAKAAAAVLARRALERAGLPRPRTLTSDAAEALLLGLWAAREAGWGGPPTWAAAP